MTAPGRLPPALVLDGETRAALAATRALGRRGIEVTVAAPSVPSLAGSSRHAARSFRVPDPAQEPEALARVLADRAAQVPGEVWLPMTDAGLAVVAATLPALGGARLALPGQEALELAWDKGRLLDAARAAGFAVPRTHAPATAAEAAAIAPELDYPAVLKPRRSRWRQGAGPFVEGRVVYIHRAADLAPAWAALDQAIPAPLIQERVIGDGIGLFLLADRGRILARFAHRRLREKPPAGGVSVLRESIEVPAALLEPAVRLLGRLAWHGVCMLEFKRDRRDGTLRLMEMNPRFWGSLELAVAAGIDFPWLLYRLAAGEPIEPALTYRIGVRSRWELGDLDHALLRLLGVGRRDLPPGAPGRLGVLMGFLNPWAGRPEVFRIADPGPAWHELRSYVRALARRPAAAGAPDATNGAAKAPAPSREGGA